MNRIPSLVPPGSRPARILSATPVETNALIHDCYEQLNALALLAGQAQGDQALAGGDWMLLLNPIVEQMRIVALLADHRADNAELRLVLGERA